MELWLCSDENIQINVCIYTGPVFLISWYFLHLRLLRGALGYITLAGYCSMRRCTAVELKWTLTCRAHSKGDGDGWNHFMYPGIQFTSKCTEACLHSTPNKIDSAAVQNRRQMYGCVAWSYCVGTRLQLLEVQWWLEASVHSANSRWFPLVKRQHFISYC